MSRTERPRQLSLTEALALAPPSPGNLAVPVFSDDSLDVELYTPASRDDQTPHTRDEIYTERK